jgi:transcriptional regulator with XRE-family HTH domain
MICTNCFEAEYTTAKTELAVTISGQKHVLRDLDCETCPACGDITFTHAQSLEIDKKRIALEFGVKPMLSPLQLKTLRHVLNMKLDEICGLLHIGRNTYGRWERGEVDITPSMNLLVHNLIEKVPDARVKVLGEKIPLRTPLNGFPDVMIHAAEPVVKKHPRYPAAKSGDAEAAQDLVHDTINEEQVETLRQFVAGRTPILVSVHAYESEGVNAIPEAFADTLAIRLGLETDSGVVQTNVVTHTGADGYGRLARQPLFDGDIVAGAEYVLVDDFVGQGGTLANLRGFIESMGGRVLAAVTLTGKPHSAKLALEETQLEELRQKHGKEFEKWWKERFGYTFDCLTQSEARYLTRSPDAETIRNRIAAAE